MGKKQSKSNRSRGRQSRRVGTREIRQRFLIVCEGEHTEPNYFRAFPTPADVQVTVKGVGRSTLRLIEEAEKLANPDNYDQVWCVFDRDDWEAAQIYRAIERARELGYGVAFSNQAFEIWYLLHFDYHHTPLTRQDCCARLSKKLGSKYEKNSTDMYRHLQDKQETALQNARRLLDQYEPWQHQHQLADCDPSTTVHVLVEELNKHSRP